MTSNANSSFVKNPNTSIWAFVILAIICFVCLWFFTEKYSTKSDDQYSAKQIQSHLIEKTEALSRIFKDINFTEKSPNISLNLLLEIKENVGCELFFINGDSIKYWTTNLILIEGVDWGRQEVLKLNNGWFKVVLKSNEKQSLIALIPIKFEYNYKTQMAQSSLNFSRHIYYLGIYKLYKMASYTF